MSIEHRTSNIDRRRRSLLGHWIFLVGCWTFLFLSSPALHAADTATAPSEWYGFRYDGRGFFPASCNPPTEFDGVTGPASPGATPRQGKNLLWKAPLPNFGNGSPIVVKDRVFLVCDVGWPLGEGDTPTLLCFDAHTGKELWRRNIDPFDALADQAQAEKLRTARNRFWFHQHQLNLLRVEGQNTTDEEVLSELARKSAEHGRTEKEFKRKRKVTAKDPKGLGWTDALSHPECKALTAKNTYHWYTPKWNWPGMGIAMAPPITDGELVYVQTGYKTLSAYDLDGNRKWHVYEADAPWMVSHPEEDLSNTPIIVDGKIIVHFIGHLWAYDKATGERVWKTETLPMTYHGFGTPQVLYPKRPDGSRETVVVTRNGHVIRAADGHTYLSQLVNGAAIQGDGIDRIWWGHKKKHGGKEYQTPPEFAKEGKWCLRFRFDADDPEKLGYDILYAGQGGHGKGFLRDGVLLRPGLARIHASSGLELNDDALDAYHGSIHAGGAFYGVPKAENINLKESGPARVVCNVTLDGTPFLRLPACPVEILHRTDPDPGKQRQRIAVTGLDSPKSWYGWHASFIAPYVFGDKLYIRTFDNLYCFGHAVQGRVGDDPAIAAAIDSGDAAQAAGYLTSDVPMYRFRAVRRLQALDAVAAHRAALEKVVADDAYAELRAAALAAIMTLGADGVQHARTVAMGAKMNPKRGQLNDPGYEAMVRHLPPEAGLALVQALMAEDDHITRMVGMQTARSVAPSPELKALLMDTLKQATHKDMTDSLVVALSKGFGKDADVQQLFREVALGQHARLTGSALKT